ncbi:MAG: glycosyltransferase [Actinomycetota bacterium]
METQPRVAIVFWEGYLGVAPSLINAARCFVDHGYEVDVITRASPSEFAESPDLGPSVQVFVQQPNHTERRRVSSRLRSPGGRLGFILFGLRSARRRRYRAIIGVDINGLIVAHALNILRRVAVILWSLEIHPPAVGNKLGARISRRLHRASYERARASVVQDEYRAKALVEVCGVRAGTTVQIPNGPLGAAVRDRSDLLNNRLDLPPEATVALHIGMIAPRVFSAELAEAATRWPDEWHLVFHERKTRPDDDPFIELVREKGGQRVSFSLTPVPYDELDRLVASGRIGLVVYDTSEGLNLTMPGSSGKIGQYLKCGLPVVTLDLPGITEVVREYGCGIVVESVDEVGDALSVIDEEWERFSANAYRCYEEVYEFGKHFQKLLSLIDP